MIYIGEAWERVERIENELDTVFSWELHAKLALIIQGETRITKRDIHRVLLLCAPSVAHESKRHSRSGTLRCAICAPLRCSKAK